MVVYNYSGKEINAKIVYYGPALSGKTTNLEWIYSKIPLEYSGKMISLRTQTDRTIFFDFLPLELGLIDGFKTRFMLYTVPGQVYYNATRKMVLKGADGVVFVADSEAGRMADNLESFQNLRENLVEIGIDPDSIPIVLQWNKRDLPATEEVAQLERQLNPVGHPSFGGCALTGEGVYETLHQISRMIYRKLTAEEGASPVRSAGAIDESSLFGDDIAERLQDIDFVDPTLEDSISVDPHAKIPSASKRGGGVLDAILGSLGANRSGSATPAEAAPASGAVAPPNPTPGPQAAMPAPSSPAPTGPAGSQGVPSDSVRFDLSVDQPRGAAPTASTVALEPAFAQSETRSPEQQSHVQAQAPGVAMPIEVPVGAAPSMEESAALALSENGGRQTMSDQLATPTPPQMSAQDPQRAAATPPATQASAPQASAPQGPAYHDDGGGASADEAVADLVDTLFSPAPEEPEPEDDPHAYGSDFGRMVDLDSDAKKAESPLADYELPSDLLESGQFTPVIREETRSEGVEPLDLIKDPLKSPSEKASGSVSGPPSGATSTFQPLSSGSRTIEVPVSIDADLLADGKTLRLVLNLKMRR